MLVIRANKTKNARFCKYDFELMNMFPDLKKERAHKKKIAGLE